MAFELFLQHVGKVEPYARPDEGQLATWRKVLPEDYVDFIAANGLCSYYSGGFRTVDPMTYIETREAWMPGRDEMYVFGLGGFGDLYLWNGQFVEVLMPHIAAIGRLVSSIDRLFDRALTRAVYVKDSVGEQAVKKAAKLVGALAPTEMYGYAPALALGGTERFENVRRYDARVHHAILAQLQKLRTF